jgi:hypothetical protein
MLTESATGKRRFGRVPGRTRTRWIGLDQELSATALARAAMASSAAYSASSIADAAKSMASCAYASASWASLAAS